MKPILIILAITALFVGAVCLADYLSDDGTSETEGLDGGSQYEYVTEKISRYASDMQNTWNDTIYSTAKSLMQMKAPKLSSAEQANLRDYLANTMLDRIETLVNSHYGSQMTDGAFTPALDKCYSGLETLAGDYPVVKSTGKYQQLKLLKDAHEKIYAFGNRTYSFSPTISVRLMWLSKNVPSIVNSSLYNVESVCNSARERRQRMSTLRSNFRQLTSSPWTAEAINESRLNEKLSAAARNYYDAETRSVNRQVDNIVEEVLRRNSAQRPVNNVEDLQSQLRNLQSSLRPQLKCNFSAKIHQLDRIYNNKPAD